MDKPNAQKVAYKYASTLQEKIKRLRELVKLGDPAAERELDIISKRIGTSQIPSNAPRQVRQVAMAMLDSAFRADMDAKDALYVHQDKYGYDKGTWFVGPNIGNGTSMLFKEDGKWYYRKAWSDYPDREMKGGFREALSNASIYYTG